MAAIRFRRMPIDHGERLKCKQGCRRHWWTRQRWNVTLRRRENTTTTTMIKSSVHPPFGWRDGWGERSRWSSCDRRVTGASPWFIHELWRKRYPSRNDWETETSSDRRRRCTLRLAELVEDHDVVGVVEVFSQGLDVPAAQSVGHEDSSPVSVRPVDTILEHRQEQKSQGRV